jgi:cathepsin A (carboxypeptidase C)
LVDGGPGCSSTTGLLFELGPCLITANGTGTVFNPYSWTEHSNMIFLDQPVNVGYSYTEGQQVLTTPEASKDVYAFLQLFMKTFPEYSSQEFNIAGESYAGTYIPNFASHIFEEQKKLDTAKSDHARINLKSVLIGNGLSDPYYQFASVPEYACAPSKHAFVDESQCTT